MDSTFQTLIDSEIKRKAMFVLKSRGSNLSKEVRQMTDELAKEFDEKYGKEN